MRVLIVGSASKWGMERSIQRALVRDGHTTRLFDDTRTRKLLGPRLTQKRGLAVARSFRPDFVIVGKCPALHLSTVEGILAGRHNAMWFQDAPAHRYINRADVAHAAAVGKLVESFFVPGFVDEWKGLGMRAKFLPSAADKELGPKSPNKRFASDVAFIGTGNDRGRTAFLGKLAKRFDLKVWGEGWEEWRKQLNWSGRPVYGHDFSTVCASAKIILGANPQTSRGATNYTSDRTWRTIHAGGFYLGQATDGVTNLLREGDHCAWYKDLESCIERCAYYLANPATRERVRLQGQHFVAEHHTYDQRIHNILAGEEFVNPLGL